MAKLSSEELRAIADLARISLTKAELDQFRTQLDVILDSVAKVQEVVTDEIKPMSHAIDMVNVFRGDQVGSSLTAADALAAAPASEDDRFRVPRILEED